MRAFREAVAAGAHAIETDLHLSRDGVVVLAHDKDLQRCYGVAGQVHDYDWRELAVLRTVRPPALPMPRLSDLLEFLATEEETWVLLDIKVDDEARTMMDRLAATLAAAGRDGEGKGGHSGWKERVLLGCWTATHVQLAAEMLPGYAVAWIGITIPLAQEYMEVPNIALNMRQEPLRYGRGGRALLDRCHEQGRPVFAWTVNRKTWMRWAVQKGLDAVITDDARLFLEVCRQEEKGQQEGTPGEGVVGLAKGLAWGMLLMLWLQIFTKRYYKRVGRPEEARETLVTCK